MTPTLRAHRQAGFSMVELMVAMTITLLLALVVTQAYLSAVGSQKAQTDVSRLQESARFAFDLVSREGRIAGFRDNSIPAVAFLSFANPFIDGLNDPTATISIVGTTTITPTILNRSDVIIVRAYGSDNAAGTAADNTVLDCQGNSIRRDTLLTEYLYVAADAGNNNEPTLYCSTLYNETGTPTQVALIPGVESMQVLYGEDSDVSKDGVINFYVPIGSVTDKSYIKSIRVSLVVRSANPAGSDFSAVVFNHFGTLYAPSNTAPTGDAGSVFTAPADGRIRRLFGTTVGLRNNL